jgi:precorrin-6A/cobalt-precorrin-6A reductase
MMLILGGTRDAVELAKEMYNLTRDITYSTATQYGSDIAEKSFKGTIVNGKKDKEQLKDFIRQNKITIVIDGTHPFAHNISQNAMEICVDLGIQYVRYERKKTCIADESLLICDSFKEAGRLAEAMQGIIYVTTGSRDIEMIVSQVSDIKRLRVRVLPMSESIIKLESLKLNSDNITAMKGPFSTEMNYLMFKESKASVIICKDSGTGGGTENKLLAARQLGIKSIMIGRPSIKYINKFENIIDLKNYVSSYFRV